jgi:hypothetical protein
MERCRRDVVDGQLPTELRPNLPRKLGAPVCCHHRRDAEPCDPCGEKGGGAGGGFRARQWHRLQPSRGPINHGEEVSCTIRGDWQGSHYIQMDVCETAAWDGDGLHAYGRLPRYLGLGARLAVPTMLLYLLTCPATPPARKSAGG